MVSGHVREIKGQYHIVLRYGRKWKKKVTFFFHQFTSER